MQHKSTEIVRGLVKQQGNCKTSCTQHMHASKWTPTFWQGRKGIPRDACLLDAHQGRQRLLNVCG